ncbi:MAG: glycosyltransferase family 4 protein [Phycisphaerales bacterium JB043]
MADGSTRSLTIVQLVPEMRSGGVERGTVEVATALVERGHSAIVISSGGGMVRELESVGARHIEIPIARKSPLTLRHAGRLRRVLLDEGCDIVHARSRVPAWVAHRALRGMPSQDRPTYITTVHGLYSVGWYSRIMTRSDRIICVSDAAREYVLSSYGRHLADSITVIPRGVDPDQWPWGYEADGEWLSGFLREHPQLDSRPVLTLPGRVTRLKGHADFIDLIARLAGDGMDVGGLIIGSVHERKRAYADSVREMILSHGLADRVVMAPTTDRVRDVYAMSSIVYSLSRTPESFGRTVLEPLTMGVPVIGYNHGGVGEILEYLCPPGRVDVGDMGTLASRTREFLGRTPEIRRGHTLTKRTMLDAIIGLYESCTRRRDADGA